MAFKWVKERICPWDEAPCVSAAVEGHLEVLEWEVKQRSKDSYYGCAGMGRVATLSMRRLMAARPAGDEVGLSSGMEWPLN
eukprot:scaffold81259_cov19-Prasinocladus_malaysianus.AAC.1